MPDTPFAEPYPEQGPPWGVPPPGWTGPSEPAPPRTPRRPDRWLIVAAVAIAVVALGVGVVGWFRPQPHDTAAPVPAEPTFTSQQIAEAKETVCTAHKIVRQAAVSNTNQESPAPGDPIGELAVAVNARLALYSGGDYLLNRLRAQPATPPELTDAVRALANVLQELAMNYLAGSPDSVVTPLRQASDKHTREVDRLCT